MLADEDLILLILAAPYHGLHSNLRVLAVGINMKILL